MVKERILIEDALKYIWDCEYTEKTASVDGLAGALSLTVDAAGNLFETLESGELVTCQNDNCTLTDSGKAYALQVIRAHRLYETLLARRTGHHELDWHSIADSAEHSLSQEEIERIDRLLNHPKFDPHGDPIPTSSGELPLMSGQPLTECSPGWCGAISHIEDEPEELYSRLVALELAAGMQLEYLEDKDGRLQISTEGRKLSLSRRMAQQLRVRELDANEEFVCRASRLSQLEPGKKAIVAGISPRCRGAERTRLLDLGVVPGTAVIPEIVGIAGSPVAYRIRGGLIALRKEQADRILVNENPPENKKDQAA